MATNKQLVQQMYIAYYQRPADPDGLSYWVGKIEENGGWEAVAADFGNPANPEYAGLYGNLSRAELVEALYQSVFGRSAEPSAIEYWVGSEHSDQNLGFAIIAGAQNDDLKLINNKVAFAELLVAEVDQAGYLALADVKAALADVTVDTNVADAVADLVADVSELAGLLADLQAANGAKDAFLLAAGQKDSTPGVDPAASETDVAATLTTADAALAVTAGFDNTPVTGDSLAVKAAKVSDAKAKAAKDVTDAQKDLNDAQEAVSKVPGLATAVALVASRTKAQENAVKAEVAAAATHAAAEASYNTLFAVNGNNPVIAYTVGSDGKAVLNTAITDAAQKAEAAKVVATFNAEAQATQLVTDATAAVIAAQTALGKVPGTDNATLVSNLTSATNALTGAETAQKTLNQQVEARDAALEAVNLLASLNKDIADANKALKDAGYDLLPLDTAVTNFATAADDVFLAGNANATINSFGAEGDDQLFIGANYTLNNGTLANGDNTVLEVFFIQNGLNTEVTLETKAFSSASLAEPEVVITLLGVNASDLVLSDEGFISVA